MNVDARKVNEWSGEGGVTVLLCFVAKRKKEGRVREKDLNSAEEKEETNNEEVEEENAPSV